MLLFVVNISGISKFLLKCQLATCDDWVDTDFREYDVVEDTSEGMCFQGSQAI